ncbi:DsrE family protein [Falsiroseomonas sp.]|uniref:DsrE family protein n=1 Tax=Falsiroseomonas sp. TaxID=2870721 RepID=UPI003565AA43
MIGRLLGRRRGLAALAAAPVAALTVTASAQAPDREQIVYHLNQGGGEGFVYYRQILRNLRNHHSVLPAGNFDLRVVMHGAGLNILRYAAKADPQIAAAIDDLKLAGVRFEICRITLRLDNIRLDELYDAAEDDLVESGVAQIARLQQRGFSYLKI